MKNNISRNKLTYSERFASYISSMSAVILVYSLFIIYRLFEVSTLVSTRLDVAGMKEEYVQFAGFLLSIILASGLLIISVNKRRFKGKGAIMGSFGLLTTLFINLYFWNAWEYTQLDDMIFGVVIVLIISFFDWVFAFLFSDHWNERKKEILLNQSIEDLEESKGDLEEQILKKEKKLGTLTSKIDRESIARIKEVTCDQCDRSFKSKRGLAVHKRRIHQRKEDSVIDQ